MPKRDMLTGSGAGFTELPRCKVFTVLQFLKDVVTNRATHSNLTSPQPSLEQRNEVEIIDEK